MPAKPQVQQLSDIAHNQMGDFFALLSDKSLRSTKAGKPFFSLQFRDKLRTVSAPVWNDSALFEICNKEWKAGQHFKIRAIYKEHEQYGPQIDIQQIRLVEPQDWMEGYDPSAFVQATRFSVEEMYGELYAAAESLADEGLKTLVCNLLQKNNAAIRQHPAATHNHHAFRGGYLEHTLSVVRTGIFLAEKYRTYYPDLKPPLNRDLIVAGCILHDIGKIVELAADSDQVTYTIPGNLIGHILIGRDMVRDAARDVPDINPELVLLLEHIILSHQGTPEWGSPRPPMFPEALIVHYADDLDAKMNMMVQILENSEGDNPFTEQKNSLSRKILRQRTV